MHIDVQNRDRKAKLHTVVQVILGEGSKIRARMKDDF
jgi:hypothetical protein